jgi:hypothetical protein
MNGGTMPAPRAWSEPAKEGDFSVRETDLGVWMLSAPGSQLRLAGVTSAVASGMLAKFQWP